MTDRNPGAHRVLVPVEILRGEAVPDAIIETFASVPIVLLGYHELPDQTVPSQARNQFEGKAQAELDDLVSAIEAAGGDVTTRLVFTHDAMKTFERVAVELECDSILLLNPAPVLERVLVPVRGDVNVRHIGRLVGYVVADTDVAVTLLHVTREERGQKEGHELLTDVRDQLEATGVSRGRVSSTVVVSDSPRPEILAAADDHDLVVLGEDRPSARDVIFGDMSTVVAERAVCPVLVVRKRYLKADDTTA